MTIEQQLREAYDRASSSEPGEAGAYDRFLRRRARRGRVVAGGASLALVVLLGAVGLLAGVLGGREAGVEGAGLVPAGSVVRIPRAGFEVAVPPGWNAQARTGPQVAGAELRPDRAGPDTPGLLPGVVVLMRTVILTPGEYPGPRRDENRERLAMPGPGYYRLSGLPSDPSPLRHGWRPDGRPYVWRARLGPGEVGEYAIAWPYYCPRGVACSPDARWRVLLVQGGSSNDPATRAQLLGMVRQVVNTARPITNALPGGDPTQVDPAVPQATTKVLLGSGGSGTAAWKAYVHAVQSQAIFELHFPYLQRRPGRGVHAEAFFERGRRERVGVMTDCLDWLRGSTLIVSGPVRKDVAAVRIELQGQRPVVVATLGRDKPGPWGGFVSPPLPAASKLVRVVALDASDQEIGTALTNGTAAC
jgi:hypothetical protein